MDNVIKKRNLALDLFKVFLAFLVICIHFAGEAYPFFPLYRLAVPTFFMISGYFNYHPEREVREKKTRAFLSRSVKYMVFGFGLYVVFDFFLCYAEGKGVGYYFTTLFHDDLFLDFFFLNTPVTYSGYQLWFLIALFVLSLIHFLMVKHRKEKWYYLLVPACIAVYLFFSGYMHLLQYTDMPIRYTRNALFFGLPNFALGYLMAKHFGGKAVTCGKKALFLALGVLFFFLQIAESRIVVMEMYLSTVLSAFFFLRFFTSLGPVKSGLYYKIFGKDLSFSIYLLHVAVGIVLGKFVTFEEPMLKCTAVLLLSILLHLAGRALSIPAKKLCRRIWDALPSFN